MPKLRPDPAPGAPERPLAPADAPARADDPAAADDPPKGPWRRVALCQKAVQVYFGGALVRVLGGELITEVDRVAVLVGDPAFRLFEVESAADIDAIRHGYAREVEELRAAAAALGLVVYRDGEVEPPRRRG